MNPLEYLKKDYLLHIDMIAPIIRNTAEILDCTPKGILLKELKSGAYMLTAEDLSTGLHLLDSVQDGSLFSFHQEFMLPWAMERYGLSKSFACYQAVYEGESPLAVASDITVAALDIEFLDLVSKEYDGADREYMKGRIEAGELFGGFAGGCLCGFIGLHEEGSMGMLKILEDYRNRGYGSALVKFMVNHVRGMGFIPFGQVVKGNAASYHLHKKLGFTISDTYGYWLF